MNLIPSLSGRALARSWYKRQSRLAYPGTLIGGFRYLPIAPFLLAAGTYTIGAYYKTASIGPQGEPQFDCTLVHTPITSASGLFYLGPRSAHGFTFPSGHVFGGPDTWKTKGYYSDHCYFGPNFLFTCPHPTQAPTAAPQRTTTVVH
jgi:hypothetical protein